MSKLPCHDTIQREGAPFAHDVTKYRYNSLLGKKEK
jgi:hypothetical protein